ncbi:putative type III effector Hrp-dependent outers [Actinacidiphila reveromycinica]|uniref:Putative type III effector Hrp-dependent outers n=1 Tax=Actinacidiphila reveromycinica TaxID=659352 RepID=A0A7U3UQZ2_9ACTN|nr:four-carbon acid sugar kinase family protein [Streptomyces sp. SN-593]BBA97103.1 putative type III effector Hrp-dependent outers [Streptomyces sp. SN-593]
MPSLGAIADDFTGATDLATMLVTRGFRTVVTVGVPGAGAGTRAAGAPAADVPGDASAGTSAGTSAGAPTEDAWADADAVVVALKSRTAPVAEAVGDSVAALRALRAAGCTRFYFKYCSTFDSTPRGNIGPVADALLDELGQDTTVVVPSFPATGRTVYRSRLFVHDDLLDESPMRDHPLTPMRDAHLGRLLAPQTRRQVGRVRHETVRAGAGAVREALLDPAAGALTVVDATTDEDLRVIAAATAHLPLVTGAAGLALGMTGPRGGLESARAASTGRGPAAVLSGSASATTRAQVKHARGVLPSRALDVSALRADLDGAVSGLVAFVQAAWRSHPGLPPMIYATDDQTTVPESGMSDSDGSGAAGPGAVAPDAGDGAATGGRTGDGSTAVTVAGVTAAGGAGRAAAEAPGGSPGAGGRSASELVETALARCAAALVAAGARHLLVAGGETSGAVVTAIGAHTLRVGAPIAPGVAWTHTEAVVDGVRHPVDLALKSGNFGATDMFTTAWGELA